MNARADRTHVVRKGIVFTGKGKDSMKECRARGPAFVGGEACCRARDVHVSVFALGVGVGLR
jgi:hypothetical protein